MSGRLRSASTRTTSGLNGHALVAVLTDMCLFLNTREGWVGAQGTHAAMVLGTVDIGPALVPALLDDKTVTFNSAAHVTRSPSANTSHLIWSPTCRR